MQTFGGKIRDLGGKSGRSSMMFTKPKQLIAVVLFGGFLIASVGCSGKTTPSIKSVVLTNSVTSRTASNGVQQVAAGPSMSTFGAHDTIHAVILVNGSSKNPDVRADFIAVSAGGVQNHDISQAEGHLDKDHNQYDAKLTNNQAWPSGSYRVDIYLNDKLSKSLSYSVQ